MTPKAPNVTTNTAKQELYVIKQSPVQSTLFSPATGDTSTNAEPPSAVETPALNPSSPYLSKVALLIAIYKRNQAEPR